MKPICCVCVLDENRAAVNESLVNKNNGDEMEKKRANFCFTNSSLKIRDSKVVKRRAH